jgi:dTDP-L-rhamnose 4-epimerase
MNPDVYCIKGSVLDYKRFVKTILYYDIDTVVHFAAKVGVGQSLYEIREYTDTNVAGMSNLLDIVVKFKTRIKRMLVAGSMSCYGEGQYRDEKTGKDILKGLVRTEEDLKNRKWDFDESICPVPTTEDKIMESCSVYAYTKKLQEEMMLSVGNIYGIPTISLRFFNVYGKRQALSNPYTGVAAVFCGCFLSGKSPVIFEDGKQKRDFIHVDDVVTACMNALVVENPQSFYQAYNIGFGIPVDISSLAFEIRKAMNAGDIPVTVPGKYRIGDIRHCFSDISKAKKYLEWNPSKDFSSGVMDIVEWVKCQKSDIDIEGMKQELEQNNLVR